MMDALFIVLCCAQKSARDAHIEIISDRTEMKSVNSIFLIKLHIYKSMDYSCITVASVKTVSTIRLLYGVNILS